MFSTYTPALLLFAGLLIGFVVGYLVRKSTPAPGPFTERYSIMARFKLPDNQPDFDIEVTVTGKDSEGNPADVTGITLAVDNSNPTAIEGTVKSSTPATDNKSLKVVVGCHVGNPSPDLGVVGYKAKNTNGDLVGAGSDEFLIGTGALTVATISSVVPFTPEPEAPPPAV